MEALAESLQAKSIPLENIYLDPNNPRFVGKDWSYVPDPNVHTEDSQSLALSKLMAGYSIDKLSSNMQVNGYLPIDRIVVRKISEDVYVVLEGNRRIAAAKTISEYKDDGSKISDSVIASTKIIPCLLYTGSESNAAWIFQGLRHITGINDWSAYNKARLLVEQMENEDLSLTDVGQRFGLSSFGAGQWVRGYKAYLQAKEDTDYIEEIDERIYPYIQEIFGRSSIPLREWLDWNDTSYRFERVDLLNEYISWFYPREKDNEAIPEDVSSLGDWDKRVIGKRDDMRQMAYLISKSPNNFKLFRDRLDLEAAYAQAVLEEVTAQNANVENIEQNLFDIIEKCKVSIQSTPISLFKNPEKLEDLKEKIAELVESTKLITD